MTKEHGIYPQKKIAYVWYMIKENHPPLLSMKQFTHSNFQMVEV